LWPSDADVANVVTTAVQLQVVLITTLQTNKQTKTGNQTQDLAAYRHHLVIAVTSTTVRRVAFIRAVTHSRCFQPRHVNRVNNCCVQSLTNNYLNHAVEKDAATKPPNLISLSCDLDLWCPDTQS